MPEPANIRVVVVEDDRNLATSLGAIIEGTPGLRCAGVFRKAEWALAQLPETRPDVVLLDLELPGMSGLECLRELRRKGSQAEVLVLTVHRDPESIFDALEAGATGYLVKPVTPAQLVDAITEIHQGGAPMSASVARLVVAAFRRHRETRRELERLTARELEVLRLLAEGHLYKEIADRLEIAERTVGTHIHHIYEKLHVNSGAGAAAKYVEGRTLT